MHSKDKTLTDFPRVAVLLAAYNGSKFLNQQIESILSQDSVNVTVYVSVDKSSDGTEQLVDQFALCDIRVKCLPHGLIFGGAAPNFFRLICEVDFTQFDFVSFADQDDIWLPNKLKNHINLAERFSADGVSSNVLAFWQNGRQFIIDKAQPQRELDYLFESAGPGCTFLTNIKLIKIVRDRLLDSSCLARNVAMHDWLIYAICRASGGKWFIDEMPSVKYRQHEINVMGANVGITAKLARFKKLKQGWYRAEILKILSTCLDLSDNNDLLKLKFLIATQKYFTSLRLLGYVTRARRRLMERVLLAISILLGLI